jgi:hypothetical protein
MSVTAYLSLRSSPSRVHANRYTLSCAGQVVVLEKRMFAFRYAVGEWADNGNIIICCL